MNLVTIPFQDHMLISFSHVRTKPTRWEFTWLFNLTWSTKHKGDDLSALVTTALTYHEGKPEVFILFCHFLLFLRLVTRARIP